ncbi:hypothetical protein [Aquisphaera insulae]|uniref:hypothetical protein n=1 Tax=Aquisphaera insulae TaxID=2712864 RepID=UPI0013ED477F|nr:hypothetical protein [Aquisphaera insulae]
MYRKWIGLAATAALIVACGLGSAQAQEKKEAHEENETPLGKIMEKVQKLNIAVPKYVRNAAQYQKSRKDLDKALEEYIKLAKDSKSIREPYVTNVKDVKEPVKKWDEIMDAWEKTLKEMADGVKKEATSQKDAKQLYENVKKTCVDCHTIFRVEKEAF